MKKLEFSKFAKMCLLASILGGGLLLNSVANASAKFAVPICVAPLPTNQDYMGKQYTVKLAATSFPVLQTFTNNVPANYSYPLISGTTGNGPLCQFLVFSDTNAGDYTIGGWGIPGTIMHGSITIMSPAMQLYVNGSKSGNSFFCVFQHVPITMSLMGTVPSVNANGEGPGEYDFQSQGGNTTSITVNIIQKTCTLTTNASSLGVSWTGY